MTKIQSKIHIFLKGGQFTACGVDILKKNIILTCRKDRMGCKNCSRTKIGKL